MAAPYRHLQNSFTAGWISPMIAARVELEKYQMAMIEAKNAWVLPYGTAYRRPGTIYVAPTKYADKKSILQRFFYDENTTYVLEFGEKYVRIYLDGKYQEVEVVTPFLESDLSFLRCAQSVDVLFITSRRLPIQKLTRYSATDWRLEEVVIDQPPFGEINKDEGLTLSCSGTTGTITVTASKSFFTADHVGMQIKMTREIGSDQDEIYGTTTGRVLICEPKTGWQMRSRGVWSGEIRLERMLPGGGWQLYRRWTSSDNFNVNENGINENDEIMYLRQVGVGIGGNLTGQAFTLTTLPFVNDGIVKITKLNSPTSAQATIINHLVATWATNLFFLSEWNAKDGYPFCVAFFQDRLVFAGKYSSPISGWMSQTGDYFNFSTQSEDGKLTDNSAINFQLVNRELYEIRALIASQDLIILTAGNAWMLSGSTVVKPTDMNPRTQSSWGCDFVEPLLIGGRIVYSQANGGEIRDMGYSFEADGYTGTKLSLFISEELQGKTFVSSAYAHEPVDMAFFVMDDGRMLTLTYLVEEKVYAWSVSETDGQFEEALVVSENGSDVLYLVVRRIINGQSVRYLERILLSFAMPQGDDPIEYTMMDCSMRIEGEESIPEGIFSPLAGKNVQIVGKDQIYPTEGIQITADGFLEGVTYLADQMIVGLPYEMLITLPEVHVELKGKGSTMGRRKAVNSVLLRTESSYGGFVYDPENPQGALPIFDAYQSSSTGVFKDDQTVKLRSGEVFVNLSQSSSKNSQITIRHSDPYPFYLLWACRDIVIGE